MGRPKNTDLELRNRSIVLELREGKSRDELCAKHGLSPARLSQIITETAPKMPDETMRAFLMLKYEQMEEQINKHATSKGRPITSGKGDHVINGETGEYAYDPSPAIQAIEVRNRILTSISRLYGVDKMPVKPVEVHPELDTLIKEFGETAQENLALKEQLIQMQSRLAAVEGSVPADVVD